MASKNFRCREWFQCSRLLRLTCTVRLAGAIGVNCSDSVDIIYLKTDFSVGYLELFDLKYFSWRALNWQYCGVVNSRFAELPSHYPSRRRFAAVSQLVLPSHW